MAQRYINVIVFGATGDVGRSVALEAHKRGAKVHLAMRDTTKSINSELDDTQIHQGRDKNYRRNRSIHLSRLYGRGNLRHQSPRFVRRWRVLDCLPLLLYSQARPGYQESAQERFHPIRPREY